jgi:hypothetical protein
MAGSKKAVRAALRDEKRKRLAEEDGTVVEQSVEAEDNEEEGMLSCPIICAQLISITNHFRRIDCYFVLLASIVLVLFQFR